MFVFKLNITAAVREGRDWQGREDTKEEETEKKTEKEAGKPQEKLEAMKKKKTDVKKENGKDETEKFIQFL